MKTYRLICAAMLAVTSMAMTAAERPKLVVNIVVDQLRTDYVENLKELFGPDGLRRLMTEGVYMRDVDFGVADLDAASATAMLLTGSYPAMTGVPSASLVDFKTGKSVSALNDPDCIGNFTTLTLSPRNLTLSTVSDEVGVDGLGLSAIHAVAPTAEQAIVMAGHNGTSATWLDVNKGKWAGTAYYPPLPQCLSNRNYQQPLSSRLDTMCWRPLLPMERYINLPRQKRAYEFRHTFPRSDRDAYARWLATPLANQEITSIAIDYLDKLSLGSRGDVVDILNIGYSAAPYQGVGDGDFRAELQDTYLRLDRDLSRLLAAVNKKVGLDNCLIFLSSTGYYNDATPEDPKYKIPTGKLSVKRATSLLNAFLSARYGNGSYVTGYADSQIYLNRDEAAAKNIDLEALRTDARDFLIKMSGIADAATISEVIASQSTRLEPVRRRLDPKSAGDIYLFVAPGWTLVEDLSYPERNVPVRYSSVLTPAFVMRKGLEPRVIDTTVDALRLAPTLTQLIGVRSPNATLSRPLPLF